MQKSDIIIIGSGPGGYRAAEYAARKGKNVVIIEEGHAGGTCLNCGCIPTKTLCRNAEIISQLRDAETYGITDLRYSLDFTKVAERKQQVVEQLRGGVEALMSMPGITLVHGHAEFKDSKTITVNDEEYGADYIIIATGSHSKMPPVEGINLEGVVTSTEMLDMTDVPKRLCIIGAGVIGMEFASIFNSFGSEVTVVEFLKECLPMLDNDIAKRLRQSIAHRGVTFHMQSAVKTITKQTEGGALDISFEKKGKEEHVEADMVLVATGRAANTDGLGLDVAGIEHDRKGIITDENMQTNIAGIYAIGDVNGRCMLAHAATAQGLKAVNHILGISDGIRLDIMPSAIFTNPEAATVGLTEDQCKEKGLEYKTSKSFYRANGKAMAMNETDGVVKFITYADGRILGCHIYGAHAADLIQEVCCLMNRNATAEQLKDIIHTHPTLEEILQDAAERA